MNFDDIQFEEDLKEAEATIDRIAFEDCSIRLMLGADGSFYDYPEEEVDALAPVHLTAYYQTTGKIVDYHRAAFNHFIENVAGYEDRLSNYLADTAKRVVDSALEASDRHELRELITKHSLGEVAGLKKQIRWSGLGLYDHGWEGIGFVTFDFNCGWDEEHGVSILMHKGKIIAESGLADFTGRGNSLINHAKCIQGFSSGYDIKLP